MLGTDRWRGAPRPDGRHSGALLPRLIAFDAATARRAASSISEWRWVALAAVGLCLVVELPFVVAYSQAVNGRYFTGMFWAPHDFAQFSAAMREGAAGASWLVHDHLSGEPHRAVLMYLPYVLLGKLAVLVGIDFQAAYHLAEIVTRLTLLAAIYALCVAVLPRQSQRRVAFGLIVTSSGVSAAVALMQVVAGVSIPSGTKEFTNPEVSTFLTLFTPPHLMLGLALLFFAACLYLRCISRPGLRVVAATLVVTVLLSLTNSFSLITLCAAVAGHLPIIWLTNRPQLRHAMLGAASVALGSAPIVAYNALVFGRDPFWSATYVAQNVLPSPTPYEFLTGYGLLVVLALAGLRAFVRDATPARSLVLSWVVLTLLLMYLPIGIQRRFAYGLHPMLGLVAALGAIPVWRWIRRPRRVPLMLARPILTFAFLEILVGSTFGYYVFVMYTAQDPIARGGPGLEQALKMSRGAFQSASLRNTGLWLADVMEDEDVILASTETANYLAGIVPGRVYSAHFVATLRYTEKLPAMERFYRGESTPAESLRFLHEGRIRFVVYGPHEREIGATAPPPELPLVPVYHNAEVTAYEVRWSNAAHPPAGDEHARAH